MNGVHYERFSVTTPARTAIRVSLPLPTDVLARLLIVVGDVWPDATIAQSDSTHEMVILVPNNANANADATADANATATADEAVDRAGLISPVPTPTIADPDGAIAAFLEDWPYRDVRPELYTGDLSGTDGNAFAIWARCRAAMAACDDLEPATARIFYRRFVDAARTMRYPQWLDLMRVVFDWCDDVYANDPTYSAAARLHAVA